MKQAITRALAATNGGPGLTAADLASLLGTPEAVVRNTLSQLVFDDRTITCAADGRFKLGDPTPLITLGG
jgi:DNA-binding IclR family transcriptional regulator